MSIDPGHVNTGVNVSGGHRSTGVLHSALKRYLSDDFFAIEFIAQGCSVRLQRFLHCEIQVYRWFCIDMEMLLD